MLADAFDEQYAVDYLKVKHIIVCGHYDCGAVKAASTAMNHNAPLENWLTSIRDVKRRYLPELTTITDEDARRRRLVELNVIERLGHYFFAHPSFLVCAYASVFSLPSRTRLPTPVYPLQLLECVQDWHGSEAAGGDFGRARAVPVHHAPRPRRCVRSRRRQAQGVSLSATPHFPANIARRNNQFRPTLSQDPRIDHTLYLIRYQNLDVNYKELLEECKGVYDMYNLEHQLMEVKKFPPPQFLFFEATQIETD